MLWSYNNMIIKKKIRAYYNNEEIFYHKIKLYYNINCKNKHKC